ncbi:MAG: hypothetical protein E5W91_14670 [Mesorhizobium sp.]|uniref:hypothetical protein n=1 Tax=Mesorhizobium sp. TaxID=1871066 RepID=UPI00120F379F|nr:hypothetical protein [Mesorhizobium sp.]TIS57362.1 MAG: hypothetical protein E5W91_14670 [Mesorhizobium sp.]
MTKPACESSKKFGQTLLCTICTSRENLLVVEAKRIQKTSFEDDIRKLTLMTLQESVDPDYHYGYVVGVHLVIDLPNRFVARHDIYRLGAIDAELTAWFSTVLAEANQRRTPAQGAAQDVRRIPRILAREARCAPPLPPSWRVTREPASSRNASWKRLPCHPFSERP